MSKQLQPAFHATINQQKNLLAKQLYILNWYFEQINQLPSAQIIQYETMIESKGEILSSISQSNDVVNFDLKNQNISSLYDKAMIEQLGKALLAYDRKMWLFYTKEEIEWLMEQYTK